ncbi:Uu.00g011310.m01.CDS01 [Anthostomella pinea]|uniref:Uu.00g011310.m01.CDS01 n=1 Tax=Anthostomella pinea TaxID=933095 RepID=A0AAI8VXR0_9PEZI|nr:Uu.00g011310.m01.CDS01 [Anthostomella pinea]
MGMVEQRRLRSLAKRLSRGQKITLGIVLCLFIVYVSTSYDSRLRSFLRFEHNVVEDYFQEHHPSDSWLFKKQRYPIDPDKDVGIILKTGYGTRNRVPVAIEALNNESFFADTLVVQDFPPIQSQLHYALSNGKDIPVVDIIGWNLERGALKGKGHTERILKYKNMAEAIEAEEWALSDGLGKDMGWELDAMKFLPGLEYAWNTMPKKKWYIMLDDDTYMIKSSMSMLVGHLNYGKPHFLGNPVGDYKGRFPHGGSSVILSGAALSKLYDVHPQVVAEGNLESPSAIYGDKLMSTTFMKIGVYLDETYRRMFNGENPWMTRLWADRLCLPLVGFHGLGNHDDMRAVGETFGGMREPVFWKSLGKIYGAPDYATYVDQPIRNNMDYVGRLDEWSTSVPNTTTVEECLKICDQQSTQCLAWTYDPGSRYCHFAPWSIVGNFVEGWSSGVNGKRAQKLLNKCHSPL